MGSRNIELMDGQEKWWRGTLFDLGRTGDLMSRRESFLLFREGSHVD